MQLHKIAILATALGLAGHAGHAQGIRRPQAAPVVVQTHGSQWITLSDGCSYSRTQAPGYPPMWVLIRNPHHVGQPPAHNKCRFYIPTPNG